MIRDLNLLQHKLGYQFKDESLLALSLTHRSRSRLNNERLEFLGDAVLGACIAELLYHHFPQASEGQLSQMRTLLVKGDYLIKMAHQFDLLDNIDLGASQIKSGTHQDSRLLEDAFEAIIGAMYLDCNHYDTVKNCISQWYQHSLDSLDITSGKDAKTMLQECLQKNNYALPEYSIIKTEGKDHEKTFHVKCQLPDLNESVVVVANKKKSGENQAAQILLKRISNQAEFNHGKK